MLRLRRFASLLLVALWLPVTLHCDFEAAGLEEFFSCSVDQHASATEACAGDACDLLENGWFKRASSPLVVTAPSLCACLLGFACPLPAPSLTLTPPDPALTARVAAPPEIARTWQFVARAAPPSRAPSFVS